jgi:hypothetical protein
MRLVGILILAIIILAIIVSALARIAGKPA